MCVCMYIYIYISVIKQENLILFFNRDAYILVMPSDGCYTPTFTTVYNLYQANHLIHLQEMQIILCFDDDFLSFLLKPAILIFLQISGTSLWSSKLKSPTIFFFFIKTFIWVVFGDDHGGDLVEGTISWIPKFMISLKIYNSVNVWIYSHFFLKLD